MCTHTHIYIYIGCHPNPTFPYFLFVFSFCVCVLFCFSHTHTHTHSRIFVFHFCAHRCDWRCRGYISQRLLHKAPQGALKKAMTASVVVVVVGAPTLAQIIWAAPSSSSSINSGGRPNIQTFHISFCLCCRLLYMRRKYKVRVSVCVCV